MLILRTAAAALPSALAVPISGLLLLHSVHAALL